MKKTGHMTCKLLHIIYMKTGHFITFFLFIACTYQFTPKTLADNQPQKKNDTIPFSALEFPINLSEKLPPTKEQNVGDCYAYSGVSVLESAIERKYHKIFALSEEVAATCSLLKLPLETLESRLKELPKEHVVEAGYVEHIIDMQLRYPEECVRPKFPTKSRIYHEVSDQVAKDIVDSWRLNKRELNPRSIHDRLQTAFENYPMYPDFLEKNLRGFTRFDLTSRAELATTFDQSGQAIETNYEDKKPQNPQNLKTCTMPELQQKIETLLKNNIAIAANLNIIGSWLLDKKSSQFEFYKYEVNHAITIIGIAQYRDTETNGSQRFYLIRNSEIKFPLMLLPIEETCRFKMLTTVLTDDEYKTFAQEK